MKHRSALLAAVVLCASVEAWGATQEEQFLATFKKFGVLTSAEDGKKPCLCAGGNFDGRAGRVFLFKLADRYAYDCRIQFFNAQGGQSGSGNCIATGGSLVLLSK